MASTTDSATLTNSSRRILSGMRPTGKLHLGNYMGALHNWVRLQNETDDDGARKYECYFFIADYHALTTDYADPSNVAQNTLDVALDWLSAGLDPEICTLFVQSHVPQHAELHLLLSMITPLGWLERVPSYKEQQENLSGKDLNTYGFLGYPLLQSADILLYQADFVPVGQDQVAHIELTREVARRFNQFALPPRYRDQTLEEWQRVPATNTNQPLPGAGSKIFPEPRALLTPSPKLPGTDGRKMSKSYNNTILLTDLPSTVDRKLKSMTNGGQRVLASIPGDPDICPVGDLHRVFSTSEIVRQIEIGCRTATITCVECKHLAARSISAELASIQTRRSELDTNTNIVSEKLEDGAAKARKRAQQTLDQVKDALGLPSDLRRLHTKPMIARGLTENRAVMHDLSGHRDWWNLDPKERGDKLRAYWLEMMLPADIPLKLIADRTFVTPKGKRLYVTSAKEATGGLWEFEIRSKSFEGLVLLLWGNDLKLRDLVIPQRLYRDVWRNVDKEQRYIRAQVVKSAERYSMFFDHPISQWIQLGSPVGSPAYDEIR